MKPISVRFVFAALLAVAGCSATGTPDDGDCQGEKCDNPGKTADEECRIQCGGDVECEESCRAEASLEHCELRRADALDSAQKAFTRDAIRWACADVEGVNTNNGDDRGQEYCEYFAVVQPPPETEGGAQPDPVVLGKNTGQDPETALTTTTEPGVELTEDQLFWLEDHPDELVGQCVFTTWHVDVEKDYPGATDELFGFDLNETVGVGRFFCEEQDSAGRCLRWGHAVNQEPLYRMVVGFNSNGAAADLVEQCIAVPAPGDENDPGDPFHDPYIRGCMMTAKSGVTGFGTEWRRSDSAVCVAGMRLAECGCGVDTDGDGTADITDPVEISRGIVPRQPEADGSISLRGFQLGTWSGADELPAGCELVDTGEAGRTLVACELRAGDLIASSNDVKGVCRQKYGDNVVVHVPIPADAIVCEPPDGGQYTDSCGLQPWVVGDESAAGSN